MACVCLRRWVSGSAVVFLHALALSWTGAIEPAPQIDGQHQAAVTVRENMSHRFRCQSAGWDPRAPPLLTWYLNGEQQKEPPTHRGRLASLPRADSETVRPRANHNSTFSLRARKWDRELVCVASDPRTGESYNATVTLNVQFQPEIVSVNAHHSETSDQGLSLVLFALVRSNPPATITFVDQSGQLVANTSDFLILDSRSYPWLTNHTLRVTLSSLSGNVSCERQQQHLTSGVSRLSSEFLQSRVEVPMLGIVTGGAMAFMALLILSLIVLCLMQKTRARPLSGPKSVISSSHLHSDSANLKEEKPDKMNIPRENMSLPSNMQLNDLSTLKKGTFCRKTRSNPLFGRSVEEHWCVVTYHDVPPDSGFARYPMVGYIYKVNSTSSEEIWL
ncbi:unnamed protein product [Lampetra planeri]